MPWWAALAALLLASLCAVRLSGPSGAVLHARGWEGGWSFERHGARRDLALRHVWHGPAWTTLRFSDASSGKPLHLTVWRSEVSSSDWRLLRQLASRHLRQPGLRTEVQ